MCVWFPLSDIVIKSAMDDKRPYSRRTEQAFGSWALAGDICFCLVSHFLFHDVSCIQKSTYLICRCIISIDFVCFHWFQSLWHQLCDLYRAAFFPARCIFLCTYYLICKDIQNYNDVTQSISIPTGGLVIEFHFMFFPIPGCWIILNFPDSREI